VARGISGIDDWAHRPLLPGDLTAVAITHTTTLAMLVGPVTLAAVVAGLAASMAMGGIRVSWEPLHLNFNRLSPANGFRRLMPSRAGVDLLRTVIVAVAVGWVGWDVVQAFLADSVRVSRLDPAAAGAATGEAVLRLFKRALIVFGLVAGADYAYKRWHHRRSLRMTKQEVKEESKLIEGNPEIKGRVRRIQREMARRRMLAAVPKATVVITNPTHYAVALEYRREAMHAPRVVAKGVDHVAERIKAIAREHGVPSVENVTLARALHARADLDEPIPADLFEAVAEVLAYLIKLKQLAI
jgi:flagellar biosynthesis protein FlhB